MKWTLSFCPSLWAGVQRKGLALEHDGLPSRKGSLVVQLNL